jgi:hypothetical protein
MPLCSPYLGIKLPDETAHVVGLILTETSGATIFFADLSLQAPGFFVIPKTPISERDTQEVRFPRP